MIEIKKANLSDVPDAARLFDAYRVFYHKKTDLKGAATFVRERIARGESHVYLALDHESRAAGFMQLYPLFSSVRMARLWLLNDLYVDPAARGKGFSIALIDQAKSLVAETGACGLILETGKDNVVGNALYLRTGFAPEGEHNYYCWNAPGF